MLRGGAVGRGRFRGGDAPAVAWLFGIARNLLRRSAEKRRVESRARARLGMGPLVLEDDTLAALERIHAGQLMEHALAYLPADQAQAVRARIVDEREYEDIARELRTSEAVVRKRVSRGLGRPAPARGGQRVTDLPQLQDLLIDAARRRRRRVRARRGATRLIVLAAAAALVFLVLGREAPDRDLPAVTPTPAPSTIDQAFGVFRRAGQPKDDLPYPGTSRLIATTPTAEVFLIKQGSKLCLLTRGRGHKGYGVGCGPGRTYLDGRRPIGSFSDQKGPSMIAYAFPDGVTQVKLTLENGDTATYPVTDNGFARDVPARVITVEWRAPDGTPQRSDLPAAPPFHARDLYSVLQRPPTAADNLDDLPGARRLVEREGARAWLVPLRDAVCLVVVAADGKLTSGCRRKVADVRTPLIVAVPGGPRHVVAIAFPDYLRSLTVKPAPAVTALNGVLVLDGDQPHTMRYRGKTQPLPRAPGYIGNARPQWPTAIPPDQAPRQP